MYWTVGSIVQLILYSHWTSTENKDANISWTRVHAILVYVTNQIDINRWQYMLPQKQTQTLETIQRRKKHLLCWVMEWTLSESSNKTVYFERYTYTKQGSKIPWASSFPEPLCPTWCVTLFTKPCIADLYIYRETPFNCPCTCLLLQIQKLASCGFHFFLGSGNGFTTEITPASNQHVW